MVNRPSHPPCFPSVDVFKGWHIMALRCREASTPCDDCSPQYRETQGTVCNQPWVREVFLVHPQRVRQPAELPQEI